MSPSIAQPGELGTDLQPGTVEWERVRREHDEAAAKVARLRQLQARVPLEIIRAEDRVRELAGRLGLDARPFGAKVRNDRKALLARLPATVSEVAATFGLTGSVAGQRLQALRSAGLAVKDEGYGGAWRRTDLGDRAAG